MIQTTEIQCKTTAETDRSKAIQSYASRMAARHPQYATMADKAAAEKARATYRENVAAALASATQSDLFEIEDEPVKFVDPA